MDVNELIKEQITFAVKERENGLDFDDILQLQFEKKVPVVVVIVTNMHVFQLEKSCVINKIESLNLYKDELRNIKPLMDKLNDQFLSSD